MSPVQKATVEANGDSWATKPDTYVCNGPYMITEWTPGERIVCKKNPNYKGGWDSKRIVNNKLTFLLLENSSASFTAYNSGEAQLIKDVPTEESRLSRRLLTAENSMLTPFSAPTISA